MPKRPSLDQFRRIVVKVGSSLLVDRAKGDVRRDWLASLVDDIAGLHRRGADVLVVSSGSIALGRTVLKLPSGALKLEDSQAAAAVGQIALARTWAECLASQDIVAGQILVTWGDTEERRRYLNARETLGRLLDMRAVPVINENDTVATQEIRYGDNDRLAARVAAMVGADCLVLLSDIDGLYTDNPVKNAAAVFLPEISEITPEIEAMAGRPGSDMGSGGMVTKLLAAKIATAAGCHMAIALGQVDHPLRRLAEGGRATWVLAKSNPAAARKQWILGALKPAGALTVDDVTTCFSRAVGNSAYFSTWYERLPKELGEQRAAQARLVLTATARDAGGATTETLSQGLAKSIVDGEARDRELRLLLRILVSDGYLREDSGRWPFRSNLLRAWWLRRWA